MENPPILIGEPSISLGHLYHGYVSHNQRVKDVLKKQNGFTHLHQWFFPFTSRFFGHPMGR
jgi:hypothetical protein